MQNKNYYQILRINESVDQETIHDSYKRLCKDFQTHESNLYEFIIKMQELNKAYLTLCSLDDRAEYDKSVGNEKSLHTEYIDDDIVEKSPAAENSINQQTDDDSEQEIPIEFDEASLKHYQIVVETCSAYLMERGLVEILGEITSKDKKLLTTSTQINFNVYENSGKLIGEGSLFLKKTDRRQSISHDGIFLKPKKAIPSIIKVFVEEYS